ncbi:MULTISPECIES: hypothetical protein [unclassified Enterococcus]|uniref:hypothetical protein n=1 Tax=unclassified Enterococcus TaxID=2608891 RepID=UPI001A9C0121|nr:hypothetical protein [Enterococcus sp. DIV1271a]MBO1298672.1 hypothetical protein [Enterococcus sp. DIV1271a]
METKGIQIFLYGLDDSRKLFFEDEKNNRIDLQGNPPLKEVSIDSAVIDWYNNQLHFYLVRKVLWEELTTIESWRKFEKNLPKLFRIDHKNKPHWQKYYQCMAWNIKNQLSNIFYKGITAGLKTEHFSLFYCNENNEKQYITQHIDRGCKNGIDMAICYPNVMIYFVLDGLDMHDIAGKNRKKKFESDYTCKELRYIFRHWYELKEKVIFFENKKIVKAPWVDGSYVHAWKTYRESRKEQLSKKLSSMRTQSMDDIQQTIFSIDKKKQGETSLQNILSKTKIKKERQELKKACIGRQRTLSL